MTAFPQASESFIEANIDTKPCFGLEKPVAGRTAQKKVLSEEFSPAINANDNCHRPLNSKSNANENYHTSSCSQPECPAVHEPLGKKKGKGSHPSRLLVRITSFRRRLCDPDNLVGKYFVDCLRYAGILSDDTEAEIDFRIAQKKVEKGSERTEIEIEYLP